MRKQLLKRFRYSVREKGRADYENGRVEKVSISHGHVTGLVRDDVERHVEIYFEDDPFIEEPQLASKCDCGRVETEGPCHHQWALIEYCQKEGILRRLKDEYVPSALWRSRLEQLERAGRKREVSPWSEVSEDQGRIRYLFDISLSLQSEHLYLTSEWQKKSRGGGWTQAKRLSNESFSRGRIGDETDRRIAALLKPFDVPESIDFSAARRLGRSRLPAAAIENIMRLACETRRVFATNRGRVNEEPLTWDSGSAWKIVPRVERNGVRLLFDYLLRRGSEEMELTSEMFLIGGGVTQAGGILFTGASFLTVESSPPWHVLESVLLGGPIEVPTKEEARLFEATAAFTDEADLHKVSLELGMPEPPQVLLEVNTTVEGEGDYDCTIRFAYGERLIAAEDTSRVLPTRPGERPMQRARKAELEALRLFLRVGGELFQVSEHSEPRPQVPRKSLHQVVGALGAIGWRVRISEAEIRSSTKTSFSVTSGIDWFDVAGSMQFADEIIALPAVLAATRRGEHFIQLSDGSLGLLPAEGSRQWKLIERLGRGAGDAIRFSKNQGWLLDALLASRESELQVDAGFVALRERLAQVGRTRARHEEPSFRGELRTYQREGLGWIDSLRELGLSGVLADDMGLGKTVQVLAELEERRLDRNVTRPSIVIAPKSLVFNWAREAERFTPQLRVMTYGGPERTAQFDDIKNMDVIITTYGTLRRDVTLLGDIQFDFAILDEAQAVKNSSSQVSKAVRLLRAEHRIALSGTPIENHLGELWSIFEFLNPGMLGRSTSFKRLFAGKRADRIESEDRERVARALRPFILRRTKEDVLPDLPEKSEQTIYCDLTKEQRKDYNEIRDFYRASLLESRDKLSTLPKIHVLEALLRLRQASCHPGLIDPERMDEPSAKFEVLMPMLEELQEEGHKALIFSQFTQHLAALRRLLDAGGMQYAYLDGRTRRREEQIDRFQDDPKCQLFLISLKAGGHGLNLTAADYVFLLDPWWNPAAENQAIDRSHRIGQTKKVMAYRLISRDTAEEKVLELQERKRELAKAILSRDNSVLRDMTHEDLELLLS